MTEHSNHGLSHNHRPTEPIPDPAIVALHRSLKEQLPEITPLDPSDCLMAHPSSNPDTLLKLAASYIAPSFLAPDGQKMTPSGLTAQMCNDLLAEGLATACDDARVEATKVSVIGLLLSDIHLRQEAPEPAAQIFCNSLEQVRNPASRQPIVYELTGYLTGAEAQWQPDDSHSEELVAFFSSVRASNLAVQQEIHQRLMDTFETKALMEAQDTLREATGLRSEVTITEPEALLSKEVLQQHVANLKASLISATELCKEAATKAAEVQVSTHSVSEFAPRDASDKAFLAVHSQPWYLERSSAISERFLEASQSLQHASGNSEQALEIVQTLLPDGAWIHDQKLLDAIVSRVYDLPYDWESRSATIKNDPHLYTYLVGFDQQIFPPADIERFLQEPRYPLSSQFENQRHILERALWDLADGNLKAYIDYQLDENIDHEIQAGLDDLAAKIMLSTLPSLRSL